MSKFAPPDVKILRISGGDALTVRRWLNTGEQREAFKRMADVLPDGDMRVNKLEVGMTLVTAYLIDWTLTDDDGKLVVIRDQPRDVLVAALNALYPEHFDEISTAVREHDDAVRAVREQEKNGQGGATGSSAISPSPAFTAGATSGSPS